MNNYKPLSIKIFLALLLLVIIQGCASINKVIELTFLCNELGEKPSDQLPENVKSIIGKLHSHKCNDEALFIQAQLLTFKPNEIMVKLNPPQSAQENFFGTQSASKLQECIDTIKIGNNFLNDNKFDKNAIARVAKSYDIVVLFNEISASIQINNKTINSTNNLDTLLNQIIPSLCDGSAKKVLICYDIFKDLESNGKDHKKITSYKEKLDIEHDKATSWNQLYNRSVDFILSDEEHEYNHPSAYCYIVCAAEKAISTNTSQEMYDQMRLDCPTGKSNIGICDLKYQHEKYWNRVLAALKERDSESLEAIEDELFTTWNAHLKGEETIAKFEGELEHANAKNWQELFNKADDYVLTEEEHDYDHPSAYCYLVCAAEKSIETNSSDDMIEAMKNVSKTNTANKDLWRLKSQHEKNWNALINALERRDSKDLEELEEGIMSRWLAHLKGQ